MNKFLLIILLLVVVFVVVYNIKINKKVYFNAQNQEKVQSNEIINKINNRTKNIKRIRSDIYIKLNPVLSAKGFIAYEKANKLDLMMIIFGFGQELESQKLCIMEILIKLRRQDSERYSTQF